MTKGKEFHGSFKGIINYRFPTTETNSKALYISWFSPPHQKLFYHKSEFQLVFGQFSILSWSEKGHNLSRAENPSAWLRLITKEHLFNTTLITNSTTTYNWLQQSVKLLIIVFPNSPISFRKMDRFLAMQLFYV